MYFDTLNNFSLITRIWIKIKLWRIFENDFKISNSIDKRKKEISKQTMIWKERKKERKKEISKQTMIWKERKKERNQQTNNDLERKKERKKKEWARIFKKDRWFTVN